MSSHSSAAGGIQGLLLKLHESLSDEDTRAAALKSHDIIGDLVQECMVTATENELGKTKTLVLLSVPTSLNNTAILSFWGFCCRSSSNLLKDKGFWFFFRWY